MQPTTLCTRSSTLQDRLGAHPNGSTGVRSDGHLAGGLYQEHRDSGEEDNFEGDYFDELRSPEIIKSDDLTREVRLRLGHGRCPLELSEFWSIG